MRCLCQLLLLFCLWVVLPTPSLAAGGGQLVVQLLEQSRTEDAAAAFAQLEPGDPWRPFAEAYLLFFRGEYAAARKALPPKGQFPRGDARLPSLRTRIEKS